MLGDHRDKVFPAPLRHDGVNEHYQKEIQLITRMMTLWYIAEEGRCMAWRQGRLGPSVQKPHVGFLLEHPDGGGREDRFSFFETPLWKAFSLEALMGEIRFSMNGRPTVLGGNLDLWHLEGKEIGALSPRDPTGSMWPMELVANVAHALKAWVGLRRRESLLSSLIKGSWMRFMEQAHQDPPPCDSPGRAAEQLGPQLCRFDVAEWRLHLQRDHLPYRKGLSNMCGEVNRRATPQGRTSNCLLPLYRHGGTVPSEGASWAQLSIGGLLSVSEVAWYEGHLVLTDEGHLWYTTNVRQFPEPPVAEDGFEADNELPSHPPVRRVRGKSSIVELAGGVGLIPGVGGDRGEPRDEDVGLRALARLADDETSISSGASALGDPVEVQEEAVSCSGLDAGEGQRAESLAAKFLDEGRFFHG